MNDDTRTDRTEHSTDGPRVVRTDGGRAGTDDSRAETDGGTATGPGTTGAAQDHRNTDYLDAEVNILNPSTRFMRDHLRLIWAGFAVWVLIVFGPVTLTAIAPGVMTIQLPLIGFPLHYFLVALVAPAGGLLLSVWYARERDKLDRKYGIEHTTTERTDSGEETAAADGGTNQ